MADHDDGDVTTSSSSSSSPSMPSYRFKWDVFLSFRGDDTRHNFIKRLYDELVHNGVRTFRDDEGLERGEEIAPSLVDAIKGSAAFIAVISEKFANSKWCLEELAVILECKRLMLPVFYKVDPSDVKLQKGPFEMDFRNHETHAAAHKVLRWRDAMSKAGGISGWDSRTWDESELIQSLLMKVLAKMKDTPLGVAEYPVGRSRLAILLGKLDVKANGVTIIGFHGMGGIAMTTLTKALFNKLVSHFKTRSFISNIRQISQNAGLTSLQSKFLGDLNSSVPPTIHDIARGIIYFKEALHDKPVLLVLDDIDDANQLNVLAGEREWFHEGSRIIITTRNKEVLPENIVDEVYEVNELTYPEAPQLLSYHAFGREETNKDFLDLSQQVVNLIGGLSLAPKVIGSSKSCTTRIEEWIDEFEKLKQICPDHLQDVLPAENIVDEVHELNELTFPEAPQLLSYHAFGREEPNKDFMDLSQQVVNITEGRPLALEVIGSSMFDKRRKEEWIDEFEKLKQIRPGHLQDLLEISIGRQIVQRESYMDAGKRSRL